MPRHFVNTYFKAVRNQFPFRTTLSRRDTSPPLLKTYSGDGSVHVRCSRIPRRLSPFQLHLVLHGWYPATMTSADFWVSIPRPHDQGSPSAVTQTSPGNAIHFHAYACRIYAHDFRTGIGLQVFIPPSSTVAAFYVVSVRRASALLRLSSDSGSPSTPLPVANNSPCRVCRGLSVIRRTSS